MIEENNTVEDIGKCFKWNDEILKAISFIPFGFGSTVCNFILIIAILSSESLRVRGIMRIICALSFAEFVEAFATLIGGLYRTTVILLYRVHTLFTPLECMLLPHSWMWRWSDFATSFMQLCLTLDRLLSVTIPLRYITFGTVYSALVIGTAYTLSAIFSLFAWFHPLWFKARLSMLCTENQLISAEFYAFSKYLSSGAVILSVIFCIPVLYLTRKQLRSMSQQLSVSQTDNKRRAQLHMTVTISIQCFATLILDAIPRAVGIYGVIKHQSKNLTQCESAMGILFHLTKLNSMIAFGLYYWRNEVLRNSINNIFKLKKKRQTSPIALASAVTQIKQGSFIIPSRPAVSSRIQPLQKRSVYPISEKSRMYNRHI